MVSTFQSKVNIMCALIVLALSLSLFISASSVTVPAAPVKSPGRFATLSALKLTPAVGPPTSSLKVRGSHFGRSEAVNVYFDIRLIALAVTNGQGMFTMSIQVPAPAVPGTHWVTGIGQRSRLSAQAPFLVRTDWPQFHYNLQHSGTNPYENVLGPANVSRLGTDWIARTGSYIFSSPAVANGVVYVGSEDHNLYAFNAQSGALLWKAPTGNGIPFSSPAVANGVVYVGSGDFNLYAFNAQSGALLWKAFTGDLVFSSPAVANGVVYAGSLDHNLYAYTLPHQDLPQPPSRPNPASLLP